MPTFAARLRRLRTRWTFQSAAYWEQRYRQGGNSGAGSYGRLAVYKAETINAYVQKNRLRTVVEFGCGDGHQVSLARYPEYVGVDVSETVLRRARAKFAGDETKRFFKLGDPGMPSSTFDLALSLDVIYHLVEDGVYDDYMRQLFRASHHSVVIYSSASEEVSSAQHVRHRNFPKWIAEHCPNWVLTDQRENPFPYDPKLPHDTSFASFFFYQRMS